VGIEHDRIAFSTLKVANSKESTKPVVIHSKYQLKRLEPLGGEKNTTGK
jgi:hypothetical protein